MSSRADPPPPRRNSLLQRFRRRLQRPLNPTKRTSTNKHNKQRFVVQQSELSSPVSVVDDYEVFAFQQLQQQQPPPPPTEENDETGSPFTHPRPSDSPPGSASAAAESLDPLYLDMMEEEDHQQQHVMMTKESHQQQRRQLDAYLPISVDLSQTSPERLGMQEHAAATVAPPSENKDPESPASLATATFSRNSILELTDLTNNMEERDGVEDTSCTNPAETVEEITSACLQDRTEETTDTTPKNCTLTTTDALQTEQTVSIIAGVYKGLHGRVIKVTAKKVKVFIEGKGEKMLYQSSVSVVGGGGGGDAENHVLSAEDSSSPTTTNPSPTLARNTAAPSAGQEQEEVPKDRAAKTNLGVGQCVSIFGGTYKGKNGVIIKVTAKMVRVSIPGIGEKNVRKQNVAAGNDKREIPVPASATTDFANGNTRRPEEELAVPVPTGTLPVEISDESSTHVFIIGGKYKGESGDIVKVTPKMVRVNIPGIGVKSVKKENIASTGIEEIVQNDETVPSTRLDNRWQLGNGVEWRLPDSNRGGTRFGTRRIIKLRLARQEYMMEDTFLTHILQNRIMITEVPLNKEEVQKPFDLFVEEHGFRYELISAKVQNDGDANNGQHCSPKCVRLVYAQVSGPRLATYSLQDELLCIADFSALNPRKLMARLELLQSPAYKFPGKKPGIFFLKDWDFCEISERGNVGCGFISEDLLVNLCGGNAAARRALAIQVRIFVPRMGIFKGVLFRKRITSGCAIQLPPSMRKVGPSKDSNADHRAFLLVTQTGFHPNSTNHYVGRLLDPQQPNPPKSFKIKKLSDMIPRLWRGLNVPKEICDDYVKQSVRHSNLAHAYVVGVADPTGSLPAGHIFVTGMGNQKGLHEKLFVTRSPCIKPTAGRMVRTVVNKPEAMSPDDWEWLNKLPFGAIIFANPIDGMKPLPEMIANGDLDGDLYFVCWNKNILGEIEAEPMQDLPAAEESEVPSSSSESAREENWLGRAQQLMIDSIAIQELGSLIGKLYTLSGKTADGSTMFIRDPDAIAFADAYEQALEYGKHGGKIRLPLHLHEQLPVPLRRHLTAGARTNPVPWPTNA